MKVLYTILFCLMLSVGAFAQGDTVPAPGVEELYLAKDDGKGKAGEQVSEFATGDIPIYCVVMLDTAAKVTVNMNFVAVSVAGVKPETKVVIASYTMKDGQNRVNFTGTPEGKWTPGKYRVDIFIDGKIARDLVFEIKGSGGNTDAANSFAPKQPAQKSPPKRTRKP